MEYKIEAKAIHAILRTLDNIPYKYVKDLIPYFQDSLSVIKDSSHEEVKEIKKVQSGN